MHLRRRAAIVVLALTLAAPWVASAEPRPVLCGVSDHPVLSVRAMLSHAWSFLTSLWQAAPATDAGPRIDPLGEPTTDAGLRIDPLG